MGTKKTKTRTAIEAEGKAKGGLARAEALTPEVRRDIASRAATARWAASRPLTATHKGNFQEDFGIDVDCFVLDDAQKTAVISQSGMGAALGLGHFGGRLPALIRRQYLGPYLGTELVEKLNSPLHFTWSPPGANRGATASLFVKGYDVTVLIDLCKAVLAAEAEGKLRRAQAHIANQARIIVNASAKAGIKGLVYALAGYDATKEEVVAAFKMYVRDEAREYEKEFPNQLYKEWYRLYKLPRPERNKPWKFMHLTIQHVYTPLARSNGKILKLTRAEREKSADRSKKLHQFLSDIGVKALRTHLGQLLGIAQIADTSEQYERHVEKIFGRQLVLGIEEG